MSDWQERANKRRDERATKIDDSPKKSNSAKKDTKSWCKGKEGREHTPKCMKRIESYLSSWRELVCTSCGKRIDIWYGKEGIGTTPKPEWVDD